MAVEGLSVKGFQDCSFESFGDELELDSFDYQDDDCLADITRPAVSIALLKKIR
jgi:hypothetical protein